MIPVSLTWIADKVQGRILNCTPSIASQKLIHGVSIDSRTIGKNDLFIALQGPNFDGHKFVKQAQTQGASALIVAHEVDSDLAQILVSDTKQALGLLASAVKQSVNPKTVAITGSSGKTTVKEMVAAILSRHAKVLATKGNFNNDIGVPLTLLRLEMDHEYAVVELGANHLGEIAYTTELVKPDVATIVNAAAAHLEGFGSLSGVAQAKSEIFRGLSNNGLALLNADSQFYTFWKDKLEHLRIQSFGTSLDADFHAQDVVIGPNGCADFLLSSPMGSVSISLPLPGVHNISNAMAAAALCQEVGASLKDITEGLQHMAQVSGRLQVKQLTSQVKILDDTYNANVASVNAAIDLLASFAGRRVLVLGDMAELGEKAYFYHQQVGQYAQQKGIEQLYSIGVLSQGASDVFAENGSHFSDKSALVLALTACLSKEKQDISILVKGSRSARMEEIVSALENSPVGKSKNIGEQIAC
ncbi:MAG: UDP-N-acetylmuramoyl-tripeptide--D-alanyl-D-alanine ligase [Paraglaciecola sp.]|jgi:UDP-N-acetylmuramoyl-tripeptide--D-alanyl-D-alanine ligase